MNTLLGIAKITRSRKIFKWCAKQRHKQYKKKWAKEKLPLMMVAVESTDEAWYAN